MRKLTVIFLITIAFISFSQTFPTLTQDYRMLAAVQPLGAITIMTAIWIFY